MKEKFKTWWLEVMPKLFEYVTRTEVTGHKYVLRLYKVGNTYRAEVYDKKGRRTPFDLYSVEGHVPRRIKAGPNRVEQDVSVRYPGCSYDFNVVNGDFNVVNGGGYKVTPFTKSTYTEAVNTIVDKSYLLDIEADLRYQYPELRNDIIALIREGRRFEAYKVIVKNLEVTETVADDLISYLGNDGDFPDPEKDKA